MNNNELCTLCGRLHDAMRLCDRTDLLVVHRERALDREANLTLYTQYKKEEGGDSDLESGYNGDTND